MSGDRCDQLRAVVADNFEAPVPTSGTVRVAGLWLIVRVLMTCRCAAVPTDSASRWSAGAIFKWRTRAARTNHDSEVPVSSEPALLAWCETATAALVANDARVLHLRSTLSPDGCPMVWLDLDDQAGSNVVGLVDAWSPRLGIFVEHRDGDGILTDYQLHLVGDTWLQIDCGLELSPDQEDDEDDASDDRDATQAQVTVWFEPFMAAVLRRGEPFDHANEYEIRAEIEKAFTSDHPDPPHLALILAQSRMRVDALREALKDAHTTAFQRDAAQYAAQIIEAEEVAPKSNVTVIREVVHRHMKRVDPACASRKAVEGIAVAVAAALKQA